MASLMNSRRGRPSKGERHPFTVKLDMQRAVKLVEILNLVDMNGVEYLTPIIEEHIDAIDLGQLHNLPRRRHATTVKNRTAFGSPTL